MQSVTSFAEEDYDPDLILWGEKDSENDAEIEGEEMVNRGDWENNLYAEKKTRPRVGRN